MRRFINSLPARIISQVVAIALMIPFVSFITATRTEAQFQTLPTWAVVDFVNKGKGGDEIGRQASAAVSNEFAKLGKYDMVPQETIDRAVETLGLNKPITQEQALLRLAGEVRASTVVSGEVVNWRIVSDSGGKRADVILYAVVRDAASGLPVNGASLSASSSIRSAATEDANVLAEAIAAAAAEAVRTINSETLQTGTVLNTFQDSALINQGSRSGFYEGLELVVVRGRDQVATAVVTIVEPDTVTAKITKIKKGVQPGDKVRGIKIPPRPAQNFGANGQIQYAKPPRKNKSSDFGTLAVIIGLAAILVSGGRGSDNQAAATFTAEAELFPDFSGQPSVGLKWSADMLTRGNYNQVAWQIWRSNVLGNPVLVVDRNFRLAHDTTENRAVSASSITSIGGSNCDVTSDTRTDINPVGGVIAGQPYTYQIQLLYKVASFNLPGSSASTTGTGGTAGTTGTGGTTGTTAGTTGTTGTTGGTAGTTGTTSGTSDCYFLSPRQTAKGIATPLNRTTLISPASGATVATDENFTFGSVVNPTYPITVEYSLQFSSDESFQTKSRMKTYARIQRTDIGTLAFVPADYRGSHSSLLNRLRSDFGSSTLQIFWRVGARNVADNPGPRPDKTGARYVYGAPRRMLLPTLPPPPP